MPKRTTTAGFIAKAKKAHGERYRYGKVKYKDSKTNVTIRCSKHGDFQQLPTHHVRGVGCPACGGNKKKTTAEFIEDARAFHGNRYIYDKVKYKNAKTSVTLVCRQHGDFQQKPAKHTATGQGCPVCGGSELKTTAEFIQDAKAVHGDLYGYERVKYKTAEDKVAIICPEHGPFRQVAASHLQGHGCAECAGCKRKTTAEFIEDAKAVHGDRYVYGKVKYKNDRTQVTIICREHGAFRQSPGHHVHRRQGCQECGGSKRKTTAEFIEDAKSVHGDRYGYDKVNYVNNKINVTIICLEHGEFRQDANSHLRGRGCQQCGGTKRKPVAEFIMEARVVHGNRYGYDKVKYKNNKTHVVIICPEHGEFKQAPEKHIDGRGCPVCFLDGRSTTRIYLVKVWQGNSVFLKVGITSGTVRYRFHRDVDEEFRVTKIDSLQVNHPQKAADIESRIHDLFAEYQYIPTVKFVGWTECFEIGALEALKAEFVRLKAQLARMPRKHR